MWGCLYMKIYIVYEDYEHGIGCHEFFIEKAFTTREKAEKYVGNHGFHIEEIEVEG